MKPVRAALLLAAALAAAAAARAQLPPPGWASFRDMFEEMVEVDTSAATGNCTVLAEKIAARMAKAGFPQADLHVFVPPNDARAGNLVAVLPGRDPTARPILLHAHIDVVNAKREDWTRDPFTLIEEKGEFYGRGVSDMKAQAAIWTDTLLRYHQEGYRPTRTVKLALTCGEEGGGFVNGANWLAQNQRTLIDAGMAITEGGGGDLDAAGRKVAVTVMAAEKQSATFVLEVTNPGGHSSRPRRDNAIYSLAHAIDRVETTEFPVELNGPNRAYLAGLAPVVSPEEGAAMRALLANPNDTAAGALLRRSPAYNAMLGTTCIPVLLEAGHAGNAQPQRARATVNCRFLPEGSAAAVQARLEAAVADPKVAFLTQAGGPAKAPSPPLTPAFMDPIRKVAAGLYPGVPVVPMQETFGTDSGRFIAVGIPSYGFSGLFRGTDGGNIHGLNEHISVQSVTEGREFMYRLVKLYAEQK
jgi:acetylornithine deacetylase/succinyl-diaminopimelate desuccinylase-like protein